MKIVGFVTHRAEILKVLCGVGWPVQIHEFDPEEDFPELSISQLRPDTSDGFPEIENQEWREEDQSFRKSYTRPSLKRYDESDSDPPHWHLEESYCDPPHTEEDYIDPPHE